MITLEYLKESTEEIFDFIGNGFEEYSRANGVLCNWEPFFFTARENGRLMGVITGHKYYSEVHIGDLLVLKECRKNHIGTSLLNAIEEHFKDSGIDNINLTTYAFQAPEFYKKCGFELEYVRENKKEPKLNKMFFVKRFN